MVILKVTLKQPQEVNTCLEPCGEQGPLPPSLPPSRSLLLSAGMGTSSWESEEAPGDLSQAPGLPPAPGRSLLGQRQDSVTLS